MIRFHLKTVLFLLRLIVLFKLIFDHNQCIVKATEMESRFPDESSSHDDGWNLRDRMKQMEYRSQRQEKEIGHLKTNANDDRKEINQLKSRVAQLEASSTITSLNNKVLERSKRPYRLHPTPNSEKKEEIINIGEGVTDTQFYGPATNCDELKKIGYTLNGHYLLKSNKDEPADIKRIEVVYCQFQGPIGHKKGEDRYGFVNLGVDPAPQLTTQKHAIETFNSQASTITPINSSKKKKKPSDSSCYPIFLIKHAIRITLDNGQQFQEEFCLTAEYYKGAEMIKNPSLADEHRLSLQRCNITLVGQMWAMRGMHICHSNEDKCLAISFNNENIGRGVLTVGLVSYNEASKFQQWKINTGNDRIRIRDQVINIETEMCLGIKGPALMDHIFREKCLAGIMAIKWRNMDGHLCESQLAMGIWHVPY